MYKKDLLVIGDYIQDVYLIGHWDNNRFKVSERKVFSGGAMNVQVNLDSILNYEYTSVSIANNNPLELVRLCDGTNVLETYLEVTNTSCLKPWTTCIDYALNNVSCDGIIVADYNKGVANQSLGAVSTHVAPFIIVDSRYRSTHPDIINLGKIKIWRCTGNEYDKTWAKQFDFIVHTNGAEEISVWQTNCRPNITKFKVPSINVVDTCGAGDTFSAALAAILKDTEPTLDSICNAIPFCIEAAQDVCLKPYTAITSKRL